MLTQERLKESFTYLPETGEFIRNKAGNKPKGHISGVVDTTTGYVRLGIGNKVYHGHRLAFLYMTGEIPKEIDHINRNRSDNRWCNLRPVTSTENSMNHPRRVDNTTGITGVSFVQNRYWTRIQVNRKSITLGRFKTLEEAATARKEAERFYGFSETHGT